MKTIKWEEMDEMLDNSIEEIFNNDIPENNLEKRKMIFTYLLNNEYDFNLLSDILNNRNRKGADEIIDPLKNGRGVCNGISYAYKMLLEKVGIYSMLISCDLKFNENEIEDLKNKGIEINKVKTDSNGRYVLAHMLTLVENDDSSYSFDDPTLAIQDKSYVTRYFNYDLNMAKMYNQYNLLGVPTDYLNYLVERKNTKKDTKMESIYKDNAKLHGLMRLPSKIAKYNKDKSSMINTQDYER